MGSRTITARMDGKLCSEKFRFVASRKLVSISSIMCNLRSVGLCCFESQLI